MKILIILLFLYVIQCKELVYLSGAVGNTPNCAEKSCGLCGIWSAYSCVSKLLQKKSFPNDTFIEHQLHPFAKENEFKQTLNYEQCPLQILYANQKIPIYTQTKTYNSFTGRVSGRWAVWLITNDVTNHATLSMMLQIKKNEQEWCNGQGILNKWCKWYNYTIVDCNDNYTSSSKPLVSIYAVPDDLNTFGTVQNFDVLYQNCTNRCGIANLSCCD